MPNLPLNPVILALSIVTAISLFLYLREYNKRKILQVEGDKILEEFRQKGYGLLHDSIKKSQDILGEAELEGIKATSDVKFETAKLEQDYAKNLSSILNQSQSSITVAQGQLIKFMADLQKRSQSLDGSARASIENRVNQTFAGLEDRLSAFLISTEQKTTLSIELELKAARSLIDTYKTEQLKIIDENIIAMMEQTLSIVLAKKLTLKDQLDLIYEALEKAKVEKFIV